MAESTSHRKTQVFTFIVIVTNVLGNLLLSLGLKHAGSLLSRPPVAYLTALLDPLVAGGVLLLIVWMLSHMALLSWADLSYVMPITSFGYVLTVVASRFFLHENIPWQRWGGVALIVLGILFVSRTRPKTELPCL